MQFLSESATVRVAPLIFWFLCLAIKHVLADFLFQPAWMAIGKEQTTRWVRPLLLHCAIHGGLTTVLVCAIRPDLWFLGIVDFCIHLVIDKGKSIVLQSRRITQNDRSFWMVLGIDQTLHHLTGFGLALVLAMA